MLLASFCYHVARSSRFPNLLFLKQRICIRGIARGLSTVPQVDGPIDVATFREKAFAAGKPLVIRSTSQHNTVAPRESSSGETSSASLPALTKWFTLPKPGSRADLTTYLREHSALVLPYELLLPPAVEPSSPPNSISTFLSWLSTSPTPLHNHLASLLQHHITLSNPTPQHPPAIAPSETRFLRFEAPLALLSSALQFNSITTTTTTRPSPSQNPHPDFPVLLTQLYIAQAPLDLLPASLRSDVPAPPLVLRAGRGDVYGSSVWLGLEPTYTPWHRDPNPNLFCQLCGGKAVRLLPPAPGEALFREVQGRLWKERGSTTSRSTRIRGEEMMQGREREVLREAVWGDGDGGDGESGSANVHGEMMEAVLGPGDSLFIPLGWWHSVRSVGRGGGLNGSVNWWFR